MNMEEGKFSTGYRMPSAEEIAKQKAEDWDRHGSFVPLELRSIVDVILNNINKDLVFLEDLSPEDKAKFLELLQAYKALPSGEPLKEKKDMQAKINKLLN